MNYLDFSSFYLLYEELWAAGKIRTSNIGLQLLQAASKQHGYWLMLPSTRPLSYTASDMTRRDPVSSSAAAVGLTHQQEREYGGSLGDGNTSRTSVRRRLNYHLFLPHSDLGRRDCWHGSGSHLHCWINLMMYAVLGRIFGIEAQYLRVKRQMRCRTVYFKPPFCFPFFATSAWKRVVWTAALNTPNRLNSIV